MLSNTTGYLHAQAFRRVGTASFAPAPLRRSLQPGMPLTPLPNICEHRLCPPGTDLLVDYYVGEFKKMDWVTRHGFLLSMDPLIRAKIKMCMGDDELIDGKLKPWQSYWSKWRDPDGRIPIAMPNTAFQPGPHERGLYEPGPFSLSLSTRSLRAWGLPDPFTPGQKKITDFFRVVGINKSGVTKRPASVQPTLSMVVYKKAKKDGVTR